MRRVLRPRAGEAADARRERGPLRRGGARAVLLAVPVVPGAPVARARDLRDPVVHDHAHGDADIRHRAQPVVRAQPAVQRRGHGRLRAAAHQRRALRVRQGRAVAHQRAHDVPRAQALRRGRRPSQAVAGVHQHALHHRVPAAVPGQHDTNRRHPPEAPRSFTAREYLLVRTL